MPFGPKNYLLYVVYFEVVDSPILINLVRNIDNALYNFKNGNICSTSLFLVIF